MVFQCEPKNQDRKRDMASARKRRKSWPAIDKLSWRGRGSAYSSQGVAKKALSLKRHDISQKRVGPQTAASASEGMPLSVRSGEGVSETDSDLPLGSGSRRASLDHEAQRTVAVSVVASGVQV